MKTHIYIAVRERDGTKHLFNLERGMSAKEIEKLVLDQVPTAKTILIQVK